MPLLEKGADAFGKTVAVTKSLEDLLDEHLTPTEKQNLQILINSQVLPEKEEDQVELVEVIENLSVEEEEPKDILEEKDGFIIISPDSSADFEELSEKDLVLNEDESFAPDGDRTQNTSDKSENSSNSQNTVVIRLVNGEEESKKSSGEREEEEEEESVSDEKKEAEEEDTQNLVVSEVEEEEAEMTNSKWCWCMMIVSHATWICDLP